MHGVLQRQLHFPTRVLLAILFVMLVLLLFTSVAAAQPFGAWPVFTATQGQYIQVADSPDLDPTTGITIELWVSNYPTGAQGQACRSILGKDFLTSWGIAICGTALRSYLHGTAQDGGVIPTGEWTHIAVTYDGVNRIHYINGEQISVFPDAVPLASNASAVRLGSDVSADYQPQGAIDEIRLWNVARTIEQIRGSINVAITSAQAGLIAVWNMEPGLTDVVGGHNGVNIGGVPFLTFPVTLSCGSSTSTFACLNTHLSVTVRYRNPVTGVMQDAQVASCPNPNSAVFWFFSSNAWEVLVKTIDGCAFNDRFWVFSAAATNLFYRLNVSDVRGGANKIYFNYPGSASPAVLDPAAFATCPGP
jgi:concanavalin A-like lectin/glucanase superfamily protein